MGIFDDVVGSGRTIINETTRVTKEVTNVTREVTKVPDWISDNNALRRLAGLSAGAAGTLVAFAEGPREFVLGIVAEWIVGNILTAGSAVIGQIEAAWEPLAAIPGNVARPVTGGGSSVVGSVTGAIETVDTALEATVASAGIFAPVVTTLVWGLVLVAGLYALRWAIYEGIPLLIEGLLTVIPWA